MIETHTQSYTQSNRDREWQREKRKDTQRDKREALECFITQKSLANGVRMEQHGELSTTVRESTSSKVSLENSGASCSRSLEE